MNKKLKNKIISALTLILLAGCSLKKTDMNAMQLDVPTSVDQSSTAQEIEDLPASKVAGVGSFSVPTSEAIVARLENGLEKNVRSTAGNFSRALTQVKSNLPSVTDPTKATGFDQIQLLVYGACSDLTTGTTPLMQSRYNVTLNASIANNQANLVNAGLRMLDQYTAGIATSSTATVAIQSALTKLVTDLATNSTNTSRIAFMSVCIAANTAGTSLLGF